MMNTPQLARFLQIKQKKKARLAARSFIESALVDTGKANEKADGVLFMRVNRKVL
jgi:hypothetical protein